ncbi:hypothetical protein A3C23_00035 [Candidatus Roizmanbacteria bacterium RIFCSPHIGHO2_02_FULL_37_13b]|uniref:UPF0235 protein A3H78_03850 n=1 Tax=Candidatus Roizmanbacteria bacterium RIFCSPLOWO2_02_FULL_36_11 TaxID=1802071 RepID=A0A1F7JHJ8_9BACT|nr:MAG: hypothetical protein A3C23_00035 [Candidatus Roizmanbacteria bacterium RIFCSPHIGHO2_02_FULL_37_13b]OGK55090.1 MAG: hypothetical protein A3H78_03850 [Candidatus Roizmanbacteria bacterium RIFCSPLOWO2_02_FULL_36_11]
MKFFIHTKPNAREEKIEKIDETHFKVSVVEPPVDDKANRAVIRVLADYLQIPPSQLDIISGRTSRNKIVEVF